MPHLSYTDVFDLQIGEEDPKTGVFVTNETILNAVKTVLGQIESTPEGQELFAAARIKQGRKKTTIYSNRKSCPTATAYDGPPYPIYLCWNEIRSSEYLGEDSKYHPATLQNVIVHELYHVAEPRRDEPLDAFGHRPLAEDRAVAFANAFMKKYYAEMPRLNYDGTRFSEHPTPGVGVYPNEEFECQRAMAQNPELQRAVVQAGRAIQNQFNQPPSSDGATLPNQSIRPARPLQR